MSIADQLKKLEKDPAFQKRVQEARAAARKKGQQFGTGTVGVSDEAGARDRMNYISDCVYNAITSKFPNMPRSVLRVAGPIVTQKGEYQFAVYFEPAIVHRESLYKEGYPDGLENIIALYSHGSKPSKNAVWNRLPLEDWDYKHQRPSKGMYRHGQHVFIPRGTYVEPNSFLTSTVDYLNSTMSKDGVRIILDPKYYP